MSTPPTGATNPLRVGRRVVVRHRRPEGSHPPLTDVVGTVLAVDEVSVTIETPRGEVTVARTDFVAVKAVPPAPARRGRPHQSVGTVDLERLMADGWRGVEEQWWGDWLLRASSGFTYRGNSVLVLGDPSTPPDQAIADAERWYAARDLPPQWQIPVPPSGEMAEDPLGGELIERGYRAVRATLVMTGASSDVRALTESSAPVTVDASLTPPWLGAYSRQRPLVPGVTEQLLTGSPGQLFASVARDAGSAGTAQAVARMSIHPGWAGLQALWVDPDRRGRGIGRTLVQALAMLARDNRMPSMFLQVEPENEKAVALYRSVGFTTHHTYVYLER